MFCMIYNLNLDVYGGFATKFEMELCTNVKITEVLNRVKMHNFVFINLIF